MLDYDEWGMISPSSIMLSAEEIGQVSEPTRPVFNSFSNQNFSQPASFISQEPHCSTSHHHYSYTFPLQPVETINPNTHFPSFYDWHAYSAPTSAYSNPHAQTNAFGPADLTGFTIVPKSEPVVGFNTDFNSRIGLNLGGRTYFASSEDEFVNRLYCRSRLLDPGSINSPRCQAEGCNVDLTHSKHYHRRHKVCELHSKASTVITGGLPQRFCQQCSRFHVLMEFDNGKRSCRKRLADHNRRRRKSQQINQQNDGNSQLEGNVPNSSSETLTRSPRESDTHLSSSVVTLAISPPGISLEYCNFVEKSNTHNNMGTNSTSTMQMSSSFYSYDE